MKNILEGFVFAALTFLLITAAAALLNSLSDDKGHNRAITALEERVSLLEEASPYFYEMSQDPLEEIEVDE